MVNLTSHTVEKTVAVTGHPRTVASTQNSLYGKVYVASPDSPYLTILRTDQDIVDTTVLVREISSMSARPPRTAPPATPSSPAAGRGRAAMLHAWRGRLSLLRSCTTLP